MLAFDAAGYGPIFAPLLNVDRRRPLDAGSPNRDVLPLLESLSIESAFVHAPGVADRSMAECCLVGVWLLHDFLDESHTISQGIDTATGSFWHGIMHRREGDFSNAKYWFRRVGNHPLFEQLADCAGTLAKEREIDSRGESLALRVAWDPFAFVDLCQAARREDSIRELCVRLQQAEWEHLFDFCYERALDKAA